MGHKDIDWALSYINSEEITKDALVSRQCICVDSFNAVQLESRVLGNFHSILQDKRLLEALLIVLSHHGLLAKDKGQA